MTDKKKKKGEISFNVAALKPLLGKAVAGAGRYAGIMFLVLVALVYGFIILRINSLSNAQPAQSDIDAAKTTTPAIPRIDPKVAEQLKQLEDNSVNVQTLFKQARNNPFQ